MFLIEILEKLLKIWKDHKLLLRYCQLTHSGKVSSLKLRDHLSSASTATGKLCAFRKVSAPFWPSSVKWEDWLTQSFKNFPMLILYKLSSTISPIASIPRNNKLFSCNRTRKPEYPREFLGYCRWVYMRIRRHSELVGGSLGLGPLRSWALLQGIRVASS